MKWGIRRYQKRDGTLTDLGKERLAANRIRTGENLREKTIPKGTKMYRTTPKQTDYNSSKSVYVTYIDEDRNMYREGSIVKRYTNDRSSPDVYEHTFKLKKDIRIPSLKTMRDIEKRVMWDEKKREEVIKSYITSDLLNEPWYRPKDLNEISKIADKLSSCKTSEQERALYKQCMKQYGEDVGDDYFYTSKSIADGKNWVDTNDSLIVERSLGRATNTKNAIIKELQKLGYTAMYDNAGIGVESSGKYSKYQEGIEPLIIFDGDSTLQKVSTTRVDRDQQILSGERYKNWTRNRDEVLRDFK
jgi:hypothetical protein